MEATSPDDLDPESLASLLEAAERSNLEPLTPEDGLQYYKQQQDGDVSDSTIETHLTRLKPFLDWCEENEVRNLNNLTGRDLQDYRAYCKEARDLSESSWESYMRTFRLFLRKCVKIDGVPPTLPQKVDIPVADDPVRDDEVEPERARQILEHLATYEYASIQHIVWVLLVEAGLRISAIRALDIEDYTATETGGKLDLKHRPDSDTPLKNKAASERTVYLRPETSKVLDDYLGTQRPDVTDEYGRRPLVASSYGRLARSTIRKYIYMYTRPCHVTGRCPHEYDDDTISECEANQAADKAHACPSSRSPHAVRRGRITHDLNAGVPMPVLSGRYDASPSVIKEHYDAGEEDEQMERRKDIRESIYEATDTEQYYK